MLRASQNLPQRLREVRERIATAAAHANRSVSDITLLAVSKAQPVDMLRALVSLEVRDFGESYLNEAVGKLDALATLPLSWHFVGRLQANKTRVIAERFQWVHGLDRLHIAERLSAQRPFHAPPLQVCIQVNLAEEASKGGVPPCELGELARAVATLPRLRLRGLMCLPPAESDPARQRAWFARLRALRDTLNEQGGRLDTLSMGMSADFESAILEGATVVRIGAALFGPRPARA